MSEENKNLNFNIDGSLVVITGGNSGIGKETARKLSWAGANVLIACRNHEKALSAKKEIESETGNPIKTMLLDLASFKSIKSFSDKLIEQYGVPDVLINNAGVYSRKHIKSIDGIEMTMAVNYFGTFYLTSLLLPHMLELPDEARVVNVSSDAYKVGSFLPDLGKSGKLSGFKAYAMSKRALMYYTFELAEKLNSSNVTVNCVHPGHSSTGIWPSDVWYWKIANAMISLNADPIPYAAENVVFAASSQELCGLTGNYIYNLALKKPVEKVLLKSEQENLWNFTLNEFKSLEML